MAVATLSTVAKANGGPERTKRRVPFGVESQSPRVLQSNTNYNLGSLSPRLARQTLEAMSAASNTGNIDAVIKQMTKLFPKGADPVAIKSAVENFAKTIAGMKGSLAPVILSLAKDLEEKASSSRSLDEFAAWLIQKLNLIKTQTPGLSQALSKYAGELTQSMGLTDAKAAKIQARLEQLGFGDQPIEAKRVTAVLKFLGLKDNDVAKFPQILAAFLPSQTRRVA